MGGEGRKREEKASLTALSRENWESMGNGAMGEMAATIVQVQCPKKIRVGLGGCVGGSLWVVGRYQDKRRQTGANGQGRSEGEPLLLHPPSCLLTGPLGRESIKRYFTPAKSTEPVVLSFTACMLLQ